MKVGLFGGTFNPIHLGHLRSAEAVCAAFTLDRIYFIPAASPPHKRPTDLAPAHHRYNMVERAVAANPAFFASRIELDRAGPSFSIDTIRAFRTRDTLTSLAFLIGMDAFREIATWKDYLEIPGLCDLIVTSRPGVSTPRLDRLLPVALRSAFWYDPVRQRYQHESGHTLTLYTLNGLHISASGIRDNLRVGRSTLHQLPPAVADYITTHALYRTQEALSLEG